MLLSKIVFCLAFGLVAAQDKNCSAEINDYFFCQRDARSNMIPREEIQAKMEACFANCSGVPERPEREGPRFGDSEVWGCLKNASVALIDECESQLENPINVPDYEGPHSGGHGKGKGKGPKGKGPKGKGPKGKGPKGKGPKGKGPKGKGPKGKGPEGSMFESQIAELCGESAPEVEACIEAVREEVSNSMDAAQNASELCVRYSEDCEADLDKAKSELCECIAAELPGNEAALECVADSDVDLNQFASHMCRGRRDRGPNSSEEAPKGGGGGRRRGRGRRPEDRD